jgi:hypothetical protein
MKGILLEWCIVDAVTEIGPGVNEWEQCSSVLWPSERMV